MVSTATSGNWGSLTVKIQAIILCSVKNSSWCKVHKFMAIPANTSDWKEATPKDVRTPSLQQSLCMGSNTAQPTRDTEAPLRAPKLLFIPTSTGKTKWIFWATMISSTTTILKEAAQAVKWQLLLTSRHLHWHPLWHHLWLSPSPAAAALFTPAQGLKTSGMNTKCLNMVCEPHYKYLFHEQDNQLALPEIEKKSPKPKQTKPQNKPVARQKSWNSCLRAF